MNKNINYILILVGAIVSFYAQSEEKQNVYMLIGGITLLMIGVYRLSKTIPSKHERDAEQEDNID